MHRKCDRGDHFSLSPLRTTIIAVAMIERPITLCGAIQKRGHEPMHKQI